MAKPSRPTLFLMSNRRPARTGSSKAIALMVDIAATGTHSLGGKPRARNCHAFCALIRWFSSYSLLLAALSSLLLALSSVSSLSFVLSLLSLLSRLSLLCPLFPLFVLSSVLALFCLLSLLCPLSPLSLSLSPLSPLSLFSPLSSLSCFFLLPRRETSLLSVSVALFSAQVDDFRIRCTIVDGSCRWLHDSVHGMGTRFGFAHARARFGESASISVAIFSAQGDGFTIRCTA